MIKDKTNRKKEQKNREFWGQPEGVFLEKLSSEPVQIDGQTLDVKYQYYLQLSKENEVESKYLALRDLFMSPERRGCFRREMAREWNSKTKPSVGTVKRENVLINCDDNKYLNSRVYTPETRDGGVQFPLPALIYFHGGGGLYGNLDSMDGALELLADEAQIIIVSVDYRLSPEHPFPAANEDAINAFDWALSNIQHYGGIKSNISIGGDSFGGYLALATTLHQIELGLSAPSSMLLYYPVVDMDYEKYRSCQLFRENYDLDVEFMRLMEDLVFSGKPSEDYRLRPLESKYLERLPPSVVVTAGFDLLRDQARALILRSSTSPNKVIYRNYGSLIHGFLEYSGVIDAADFACVDSARLFGAMVHTT